MLDLSFCTEYGKEIINQVKECGLLKFYCIYSGVIEMDEQDYILNKENIENFMATHKDWLMEKSDDGIYHIFEKDSF